MRAIVVRRQRQPCPITPSAWHPGQRRVNSRPALGLIPGDKYNHCGSEGSSGIAAPMADRLAAVAPCYHTSISKKALQNPLPAIDR